MADVIRKNREKKGLSIEQLANAANLDVKLLELMESGEGPLKTNPLVKIEEALGLKHLELNHQLRDAYDTAKAVAGIKDIIKQGIYNRHLAAAPDTFHHHSTKSLLLELDRLPLIVLPWDNDQVSERECDSNKIKVLSLPTSPFLVALPFLLGYGIPNTPFLIIYRPVDDDAFLFEVLMDAKTYLDNLPDVSDRAAAVIQPPKYATPHCFGFYSGIVHIVRANGTCVSGVNLLISPECEYNIRKDTLPSHVPSYEPYQVCCGCTTSEILEARNTYCYEHTLNSLAWGRLMQFVIESI